MGTIFWFGVGIAVGVVFDQFFTRAWTYVRAKLAQKSSADISD